jgi:hypothetical protein
MRSAGALPLSCQSGAMMSMFKTIFCGAVLAGLIACGCRAGEAGDIPPQVRDDAADDWVADRFAGNSTAGPIPFQGPALEAGGLGGEGRNYSLATAPDGRAFFAYSAQMGGVCLAEVSATGMLRLIVSSNEWAADGLDETYLRVGLVAWNPKEKALCFWGKSSIRRLVEKPDGTRVIETVVGNPKKPGLDDGPAAQATLTSVGSLMINSRGDVFFLDGKRYGECLRMLSNGVVTTLNKNMRAGKLVDGPLKDAQFAFINALQVNSIGENDDVLYIGDHWNFAVRRIDLKEGSVSTVMGMRANAPLAKGRYNSGSDGPALTHASSNSGNLLALHDPVHKAVWVGGPDEMRLRWLKDGWVKTLMGAKRGKWGPEDMGAPADAVGMSWIMPLAVDSRGGTYLCNGRVPGYWRLYNKKEAAK